MTFTLPRSSPASSKLTEAYSMTQLHLYCSSVASCSSYLIKREEA